MWEMIQEKFNQIDNEETVETRCTLLEDVEPAGADPLFQSDFASSPTIGNARRRRAWKHSRCDIAVTSRDGRTAVTRLPEIFCGVKGLRRIDRPHPIPSA